MEKRGIFKVVWKKGDKPLLKVDLEGEETWIECSEAVYKYADNQLNEGDKVKVIYEEKDGEDYVTRVSKNQTKSAPEGKKCKKCGKVLKNPKYDYCYNCFKAGGNKKTNYRTKKTPKSDNSNFRSPDELRRDEAGHMTSRVVNGMLVNAQGQIDPNSITEITETYIEKIYKKFTELTK